MIITRCLKDWATLMYYKEIYNFLNKKKDFDSINL